MSAVENLVIDGERVAAAEGRTFDTVNPATEQKLAAVIPPLKDQLLYVEHAIDSGETPRKSEQLDDVRDQVSSLIRDLDDTIDRTQRFIEEGVEVSV